MNEIITPALYGVFGVCAYTSAIHLSAGLHRPFDYTHLLFAGMSILVMPFTISQILTLHAADVAGFLVALKWKIASAISYFIAFVWFIAFYTKFRPMEFLIGLTGLYVILLVVNLGQPFTLQFEDITGLGTLKLPWGEVLVRGKGPIGIWLYIGVASLFAGCIYAFYALCRSYNSNRSHYTLAILLAIVLFLVSVVEGMLVRMSVIDFVQFGPFGFLVMVITMSIALTRETRHRLRYSENRFRSLVEQSPFSIQVLAPDGRTLIVNPAFEKLWGIRARSLTDYNIFEDRQLVAKGVMPYILKGISGFATEIPPIVYNPAENPGRRGPFSDRWVRAHIYPVKDDQGKVRETILVHEDVTEYKREEDAIRMIAEGVSAETGELFFQRLVKSLADVFAAPYAMVGLIDENDQEQVTTLAVCAHGKTVPNFSYCLAGTPCANVVGREICVYPKDVQNLFPNDRMLVDMGVQGYIGTPLFDVGGEALGLIVVLDVKALDRVERHRRILEIFAARASAEVRRLRAEADIRRMAYEDFVTAIPSRVHLHERLAQALRTAHSSGLRGSVLLIDLDHFKTINDALGHDVGDEVLRAVARQLSEKVAERGFVARLGGDEFVTLLAPDSADLFEVRTKAKEVAEEILDCLSSPIQVGARSFSVGASIGIAVFPEEYDQSETDILRRADLSLYRAKNLGRGMIQLYLPSFQEAATERLRLEEGLRRVIANDELELHFQPQVDLAGTMVGVETLLRWHSPELGDISPASFVPVAEETGMIHGIGAWVIERACAHLSQWFQDGVPFIGHLSINVSPWQFAHPNFVERIRGFLHSGRIDPCYLMLELTESSLLYDIEETIEKLRALRDLGLKVAIDDFGTGYSSLAYLKDLPLDQIKIDKVFVSELNVASGNPLVESIIAISRSLRLDVIAEGVETPMQRHVLAQLGCEHFQGYYFSRPLPEAQFLQWVRQNYRGSRVLAEQAPDGYRIE